MEHIAALSYGKDSMAMLEAIKILGLPLDRIITADVWATDTIPADLPPMVEFKAYADEEIKKRYGIEVEHVWATNKDGSKRTYDSEFYHVVTPRVVRWGGNSQSEVSQNNETLGATSSRSTHYRGFPPVRVGWCLSVLKQPGISKAAAQSRNVVQYIGIAADEPPRIERHKDKMGVRMPLVEIGWTEADCRKWCKDNGLLSPIYKDSTRGGCWFCHNQSVDQLRKLRHNYPELWDMLLKWDLDSQITFKADGHTVHDFDRRFRAEDDGLIHPEERFRWAMLDSPQMRLF